MSSITARSRHALPVLSILISSSLAATAETPSTRMTVQRFAADPLACVARVDGDLQGRAHWSPTPPAFVGDAVGSLSVHYKSDMEGARLGFPLQRPITESDPFTAVAVLTIHSDRFWADPDGYFQLSWGLWSSTTTGMERTGNFNSYFADSFDLMEFDYFPNVSPWFGGPWLSPALLASADRRNPLFEALGAFANAAFGSNQLQLPFDRPLLTTISRAPAAESIETAVYTAQPDGSWKLIEGSKGTIPLSALSHEQFLFDRFGITLWHDGFGGPTPALDAEVSYEFLAVANGKLDLAAITRLLQR